MSAEVRRGWAETNAELERITRSMRQRFYPTEKEIEQQAWLEVEEERAPEAPAAPRPEGHRWQEVLEARWHEWLSKRRRHR